MMMMTRYYPTYRRKMSRLTGRQYYTARMIKLILFVAFVFAMPAFAQHDGDGELQSLENDPFSAQWTAVGKVTINGGASYCSGVLIEPHLVLTAAHCFFDKETGEKITDNVRFHAGMNDGRALTVRSAETIAIDQDFKYEDQDWINQFGNDIALIKLSDPILRGDIIPFEIFHQPRVGDAVTVVSYARDREFSASIQSPCHVLEQKRDSLMLTCDVDPGASGAPVFMYLDGRYKVVSIINALGELPEYKVAMSVVLGSGLDVLYNQLASTPSKSVTVTPNTQSLADQLGRETNSLQDRFQSAPGN